MMMRIYNRWRCLEVTTLTYLPSLAWPSGEKDKNYRKANDDLQEVMVMTLFEQEVYDLQVSLKSPHEKLARMEEACTRSLGYHLVKWN